MSVITETRPRPSGNRILRPEDKLLLSRREAAALLSISQRSLDYLIAENILPVRRIGSRVLIPPTSYNVSPEWTTRDELPFEPVHQSLVLIQRGGPCRGALALRIRIP